MFHLILLKHLLHQPAIGPAGKRQRLSGLGQIKFLGKGGGKGFDARAVGTDERAVDIK